MAGSGEVEVNSVCRNQKHCYASLQGSSSEVYGRDPQPKDFSTASIQSTTTISPPPAPRKVDPQPKDSSTASPQSTTPIPPRPPAPKKVSTKFGDVFAFSGPAPEIINGRLAMFGFVSALGVEIASGKDLFSQLTSGGVPLFVGSAVVLTLASLIPMFSGVSTESKSQAIMSARAEMWNGRFAMLGLVALALTEYLKGGPLIS